MVHQLLLWVQLKLRAPRNFEGAGEGAFLHFFCTLLVNLLAQHMAVDHWMKEEEEEEV